MWDMSGPPSVKQQTMNAGQRSRQYQVAQNARQRADAIETGEPARFLIGRSVPKRGQAGSKNASPEEDARALQTFMATEQGRAINAMLARLDPAGQSRLTRAWWACCRSAPGAWDAWITLQLELDL